MSFQVGTNLQSLGAGLILQGADWRSTPAGFCTSVPPPCSWGGAADYFIFIQIYFENDTKALTLGSRLL